MKPLVALLAVLGLALSIQAQTPPGTGYTPEQLDQLMAPIALYPDPLIALILPAAADPSDLALAAQYVASNGDPAGIDAQPWAASVKGLAHYPDVLKWMNDNLDWTRAVGAAFAMQPSDVMKSVQQMRARAKAAGTLVDTPQQQVDMEDDDIRIVPTQPDTIYVPEYDPDVVYDVPEGYAGPFLTFSAGFPVGPWLGFECDWDDFGIWVGPWHPGWGYRRDWRGPNPGGHRWHPGLRTGHALVRDYYRPSRLPDRPRPIAGFREPVRGPAAPVRGPAAPNRPAPEVRAPAPNRPPVESRPNYRGYSAVPAPSTPAPKGGLYGGYSRGTETRSYSTRGNQSRSAPVRSAPARSESRPSGNRDRR
jgi:hypothetical protein